jgi:hypothetical protein
MKHPVLAWVAAMVIGGVSGMVVVMAGTGLGF